MMKREQMKGWDGGKRGIERANEMERERESSSESSALSCAASGITRKHVLARSPRLSLLFFPFCGRHLTGTLGGGHSRREDLDGSELQAAGIYLLILSCFIFSSHCIAVEGTQKSDPYIRTEQQLVFIAMAVGGERAGE